MLNIHSQKYIFVRSCVAMVALTVFIAFIIFIHMLMYEAEKLGYFLYLIFKKLFFLKTFIIHIPNYTVSTYKGWMVLK